MNSENEIDIIAVRKLAELVKNHHLSELTVEVDGETIHLTRKMEVMAECDETSLPVIASEIHTETPGTIIPSPMVGVFYRSSSPDSQPFIKVGDFIEEGQTIGLIEAMKTYNEVPSPYSGLVMDILVENGQLVQQGETIITVDTTKQHTDE